MKQNLWSLAAVALGTLALVQTNLQAAPPGRGISSTARASSTPFNFNSSTAKVVNSNALTVKKTTNLEKITVVKTSFNIEKVAKLQNAKLANVRSLNGANGACNICCLVRGYCGWRGCCWFPGNNCCGFFDPCCQEWYYWYEPFGEFLPIELMPFYPPVNSGVALLPPGVNNPTIPVQQADPSAAGTVLTPTPMVPATPPGPVTNSDSPPTTDPQPMDMPPAG